MNFQNLRVARIRTVVRYKADITEWVAQKRKDHIIGIILSGTTYHDLGYKNLDLEPDHIYFFNQRDDYTARVIENGHCYSVHFTTPEPIETDSFCKKVNNPEEVIKLIRQVERARLQGEGGELRMLASFYALCDLLYGLYTAPYTKRDARITAAREYMDLHFRERDCLAEATALCDVTPRRFNDVFKQYAGLTPNNYIIGKRIDYATELLELGYLPIADVAELSGFSDVYYFSKMFKQKTGLPPGRYRKKE